MECVNGAVAVEFHKLLLTFGGTIGWPSYEGI